MKEAIGMLGQTYLISWEMRKVVIHTVEPVYTREGTKRLVKIFDSAYTKADLEQLTANETQLNTEERNQLLRLLKYFGFFKRAL